MSKKILVSACLCGFACRYDGKPSNAPEAVLRLLALGNAVPFCPEQQGGLPTPRAPAEIEEGKTAADVLTGKGRVLTRDGTDVTRQFVSGARTALQVCRNLEIRRAVLKSKSPSCGCLKIYDGTFSGHLIDGSGVTATILNQANISVTDENHL